MGDLSERTRALWQPRTARVLTNEDAREIVENMTGFFRVLLEWEDREHLDAALTSKRQEGDADGVVTE